MTDVPEKLGKYEILKELGSGSMAKVYLGHDPFISRYVAVKVALPKFARDESIHRKYKMMFFNEARIAGMLDYKYILPVFDAGSEGDLLYLVMEYISSGRTLKDYCFRESLLPVPTVLEIIFKCCKALHYSHARNVIHRDIKPSNILVTEEMDVRIADFGIARMVKSDDTQVVDVMGSPRYMSPEQIEDRPLTNQTDLYSLGVVMYQLLTGHTPFEADNLSALVKKILNDDPPMLASHRPDAPFFLENIVRKALSKNTATRYASGLDFCADILHAMRLFKHNAQDADTSEEEKFQRLKKLKFFQGFLDSEIHEVIQTGRWRECEPGETIIKEGEMDDSFYVLVSGDVEVVKGDKTLAKLAPGDCFGEMAYFSKAKRTASIIAAGDVMLIQVNNTLLERASPNCQVRFLRTFLVTLIERLSQASSKLAANGHIEGL